MKMLMERIKNLGYNTRAAALKASTLPHPSVLQFCGVYFGQGERLTTPDGTYYLQVFGKGRKAYKYEDLVKIITPTDTPKKYTVAFAYTCKEVRCGQIEVEATSYSDARRMVHDMNARGELDKYTDDGTVSGTEFKIEAVGLV